MDRISDVGVLDKAMAVLPPVEYEPKALAALVHDTGLARPDSAPLAVALEAHGMLRRDDEGRFVLGPRAGRSRPRRDRCLPVARDSAAGAA
jgi:DNA-binding IclR family transcriptional regulator